MDETPDHIEKPWINVGTLGRPDYRWVAEKLDSWWIEVNRWRASNEEMARGGSAGATRTGRRTAGSAPPRQPPRNSRSKSKKLPLSADGGSLATLVRNLTSGRS